jgi:hypothetical protein
LPGPRTVWIGANDLASEVRKILFIYYINILAYKTGDECLDRSNDLQKKWEKVLG